MVTFSRTRDGRKLTDNYPPTRIGKMRNVLAQDFIPLLQPQVSYRSSRNFAELSQTAAGELIPVLDTGLANPIRQTGPLRSRISSRARRRRPRAGGQARHARHRRGTLSGREWVVWGGHILPCDASRRHIRHVSSSCSSLVALIGI